MKTTKELSTEDCTDLILNELKKVKQPEGLSFEITNPHGLENIKQRFSQKIIYLKEEDNPIAILEFYINHKYIPGDSNNKFVISIKTIKGKKGIELPLILKWRDILMGSFIRATVPIIANYSGSDIIYTDVQIVKQDLEKYKKWGYISEEDINDKEKKEFKKRLLKKIANKEVDIGKQSIESIIKEINHTEQMIKSVNLTRNLFFDKEGYLNPNKERVKQIFKDYAKKQIISKQILKLDVSKVKRKENDKRLFRKTKIK
ncbi:MAG: hypothetical protein WCX82_00170 [archaeon]|jgi:hypothetical protein